jgi:hypothetical protein
MSDDVPPPFSAPVRIRGHGPVRYVAEAGALILLWPRRLHRRASCQEAYRKILVALDGGDVEEAREAFLLAALDAGMLRSRDDP